MHRFARAAQLTSWAEAGPQYHESLLSFKQHKQLPQFERERSITNTEVPLYLVNLTFGKPSSPGGAFSPIGETGALADSRRTMSVFIAPYWIGRAKVRQKITDLVPHCKWLFVRLHTRTGLTRSLIQAHVSALIDGALCENGC